jgi:hypothetical protein
MSSLKVNTSVIETAALKKRQQDLLIISGLVVFLTTIALVAWTSDGRIVSSSIKFLQSFEPLESRNHAANCSKPKNKNTPYCQERKAAINASWTEMNRSSGGKNAPYTLHGQ